jgi:hypothetical protein
MASNAMFKNIFGSHYCSSVGKREKINEEKNKSLGSHPTLGKLKANVY